MSSCLAIRRDVYECVVCSRCAVAPKPIIGNLPSVHVRSVSHPFLHVGIDFSVPLLIKECQRKTYKLKKMLFSNFCVYDYKDRSH